MFDGEFPPDMVCQFMYLLSFIDETKICLWGHNY